MAVPYERSFDFQAVSGEDAIVELGVPIRGIINRLIVNQVGGNAEGYSFDIYDQEQAVLVAVGSASSESAQQQPNQHKVIPTQTVGAGSRAVEHFEKQWAFGNHDGTPSTRKGRLYMRINPVGSGTKGFEISYTILGADPG